MELRYHSRFSIVHILFRLLYKCSQLFRNMQKQIALFGCIAVVVVLFFTLYRGSFRNFSFPTSSHPRPVDAVMIVTTMRSGSSFFGSIFNLRRNVTYLYEPLIAVSRYKHNSCNDVKRREDSITIMKAIVGCHFEDLVPIYQQIPPEKDDAIG